MTVAIVISSVCLLFIIIGLGFWYSWIADKRKYNKEKEKIMKRKEVKERIEDLEYTAYYDFNKDVNDTFEKHQNVTQRAKLREIKKKFEQSK